MKYVYIVDKHCKPLMPTTRFGHVRKLLKEKKAVPICNSPFTIKLKYDVPGYTQPVYEGIDTGRENIGDAASLENGENVFLADVRTNNKSIKKKMQDRAVWHGFILFVVLNLTENCGRKKDQNGKVPELVLT